MIFVGCAIGCVTPQGQLDSLKKRATFDLKCDALELTPLEEQTPLVAKTEYLKGTTVGVEGCGKRATYVLVDDGMTSTWLLNNSDAQ